MKKWRNNSHRASTLQIALSTGLISIFAILLALAAPANRKEAPRQDLSGSQLEEGADSLGNYPDTSIPLSTDTTVTPDAAPTNTTSINVSTSTNFKGKLEGYPTTGVVRVTDAHPAGTYTVTVRAFNGGGQTATRTFTLTVTTPPTCSPVSFAAPVGFTAGDAPYEIAIGDFNGDGKQDVATANNGSNNVSILLGNGAGNFSAAASFGAGTGPASVTVGDFNGDGRQDLAVANYNSGNAGFVSILLGDGAGNFSAPTNFGTGAGPFSVAVGDFNNDGKQDLAVAQNGSSISVLLGDGAGNFSAASSFGAGTDPRSVAVGDFNGDGNQDLAVANVNSSNVSILLGNGAGSFSAATNYLTGDGPLSVAVGDFNGDGKQDLTVANSLSNHVSILLGDGLGGFGVATNFAAGTQPSRLAVGDFNGDGKQDLAVNNLGSNLSILLGDGAGSFSNPINFAPGSNPESVAVGDFDGDGKQDLAVANLIPGKVSILMRQLCPTPTPTATATATPTGTPPPPPTLGNYPDTSLLLSTGTTVTPDAAPTNTTSIDVSTSTNFKGTLAGDPTTGVVRVTDAHPAGTYTITVRAFDGQGRTATTTFTLTVTTPVTCIPVSFAAATNFGAPVFPVSVAVGDFNGDGKQDLAVANYGVGPPHPIPGSIYILLGNGAGNFSVTNFNFDSVRYPQSVVVGDFNGDGKQDLAVAVISTVSILLGDGAGSFGTPTNFGAGNGPRSVAVGDFNGDGKQDLAVTNAGSTTSRSCWVQARAISPSPETSARAVVLPTQSRWAISMAMATKTSPWPTVAQTTCRSCWAMARAISAPPPPSARPMILAQ